MHRDETQASEARMAGESEMTQPQSADDARMKGEAAADQILASEAIEPLDGSKVESYISAQAQAQELDRLVGVDVERLNESTVVATFDIDLLFGINSSSLQYEARSTLTRLGQILQTYPNTAVIVQSHTDSLGDAEDNLHLSERRAEAVQTFLINQGISPARLSSVGYGESAPLVTAETDAARDTNRRIALLLKARPM